MHAPEVSLFNTIIIICFVLGVIIALFIISLVKQHRRNIELYKSKIAAEINTLENERARISADLHDDLGPILSAIKFKIDGVETDNAGFSLLKEAETYIDEVISKLRLIANNLLPPTLMRKGIVFTVEEFIQQMAGNNKMKINFSYNDVPFLEPNLSVNLFRIIKEIIHNAVKHSHAQNMNISLIAANNKLQLICSDNGGGFNYSHAQKAQTGLGLRNIWSRTELLKGELFVESEAGEGTYYCIELPLKIMT